MVYPHTVLQALQDNQYETSIDCLKVLKRYGICYLLPRVVVRHFSMFARVTSVCKLGDLYNV
jgi:hypothetical protein